MQLDELKLVNLSKQGNREAFSQLVNSHSERVYLFILKKVRNEDLAKEVTQVAWIKAWKKIKKFQKNSKFSTWVCRIASNYFFDHYRKNKRYVYSEDLLTSDGIRENGLPSRGDNYAWLKKSIHAGQKLSEEPKGLKNICMKELAEEIENARQKLSPEHKEVLDLAVFQDLEYQEAADKIGCPVGTVMSRVYYARKHMKKELRRTKNELFI